MHNARAVWLLSPYHTGSHRAWAEGYARSACHNVRLLTLDGHFWKWRMQGGARALAAQATALLESGSPPPAAILATDMLNLPAWLGLMRRRLPAATPILLYMHENQLTYPWTAGERRDLTYALINWHSMLAADVIAFNSAFHLQAWFGELPRLLKHFPDYNHLEDMDAVRRRCVVLPVGIDAPAAPAASAHKPAGPPLILWNQRWEYDKRPDRFFALLARLDAAGVPFRLALAGENFRNVPQEFEEARLRFADKITQWGFVPARANYQALLQQADLVISTAEHEFFGVSILEAIAAGAFPLLPTRLSYPELIPAALHPACLYGDEADLYAKAVARLHTPRPAPPSLRKHVLETFTWPAVAPRYDDALGHMAAQA